MKADMNITTEVLKEEKVTSSVFEAFDLLKASSEDLKLNGGAKIISILKGKQSEKEIKYALKRLVRSLGANHPNMRMGYFSTLTTMLSQFDSITLTEVLQLVKDELHANSSSKSDVGDVALGHILVCAAVFRSGLMLKSTTKEQNEVMNLLSAAGRRKSYLAIVEYQILADFMKNLNEEQFSTIVWSNIKKDFKKSLSEHSLDSLYFLLTVIKKYPGVCKIKKLLSVEAILCEDTVDILCEKLLAKIDFKSVNHPIYNEIGALVANSPYLSIFWSSGIDSQLVKHNRNRELVTLNLLNSILKNIGQNFDVIPDLLSNNFLKLFMDWFKGLQTASKIRNKRDNEDDHKIMIKKEKELLDTLAKVLKSENVTSQVRVETLKKLLFYPGEINFTEITGTNIIRSVMADLDPAGVQKIAKLFKKVLLNSSKKVVKDGVERNWYNNERLKAAEGISQLVSHDAVKDDTDFKLNYMKLLMCFGFFKIGGDENVAISSELSGTIKTCFYRCFVTRFTNVDSLVDVLSSLCNFINISLKKDEIRTKIEKQFPKENMECWEMFTELCQAIERNQNKSKVDKVFLVLLYQLGLFLFSEPKHVNMAKDSIKELKSCYEHFIQGKKKKNKKMKTGDLVIDEPEWIEVLVEVLLSILSTESSVLRSVVNCVFRLLCEHLTPSSIGQIVSVLDPDNESNPMSENSDNSDEDSDESDENEELNGDENNDSDGNEESDDSDVEEDVEMKTPDQLRMAIQKALGAAADTDTESIDADMIDEEEGKKLDAVLSEAFKQFHGGKSKKSKTERRDKKALSDFRIRVLDLINIYLEKEPAMDIALGMIEPLIRCLEFCIQDNQFNELEKRLRKTIKVLTKTKKYSGMENITFDVLCSYFKSTIDKGSRSHFMFQALGDVITNIATFIIHCSQKLDQSSKGNTVLTEIISESLQSYFLNRSCLLPIIFFHNILQLEWNGVYDLIPVIVESAFNTNIRQFRRNEALDLLSGFYRSLKRIKPTSEIALNKLSQIEDAFQMMIKQYSKNEKIMVKNHFFDNLKKMINTMKMYHDSCKVQSKVDFQSLLNIVNICKNNNTNDTKQVKEVIQKCDDKPVNPKKKKQKKRKMEVMNGHSEPEVKKKRNVSVT